ncbi:hypothetical protein HGH92_05180 [Chitinophaga varians]|uniref:Uncharacterized protein n=1 Tax=Chitinophaga varians TaxID=2202339 RepID=A0A847RPR9_9BACT|nr:hypothetical protein [Chitinophaga varians]NLR63694.1 hypothetical protein [Chitinophaga varians]
MARVLILLMFFVFRFNVLKAANIVLSASASGRFIVFENTRNQKKVLMNLSEKKMLRELDSLSTPISWIKDSILICKEEKNNQILICSYSLHGKKYEVLDSLSKEIWQLLGRADFVSYPLNVDLWSDLFFIYVQESKIYKYSFKEKISECIFDLKLSSEEMIDNISVNNDCKQIAISLKKDGEGKHVIIYPIKQQIKVLNEFKTNELSGSFCYFLDANNIASFTVTSEDGDLTTRIEVFNIKKNVKRKVATIEHLSLFYPLAIPFQNKIVINSFSPIPFSVDLKKDSQSFSRFLNKWLTLFNAITIHYSFTAG